MHLGACPAPTFIDVDAVFKVRLPPDRMRTPLDQQPRPPERPDDFDRPGALSIVVQGPLFQGNMVETANHVHHWRETFPHAEIILSLSVTDVVAGDVQGGVLVAPHLVRGHEHDGHLQVALRTITECCDVVALSAGALPLPPIKSDSPKLNNANLQIAAAQHGLALARGEFVLRIRSDLLFLDRGFLAQYERNQALPRGKAAVFGQRVLMSWLYTLNPFTIERMPLHFSDWFHFGRTEDVRQIWDVPPITLRDSMHYRVRPAPPRVERGRAAVQHPHRGGAAHHVPLLQAALPRPDAGPPQRPDIGHAGIGHPGR